MSYGTVQAEKMTTESGYSLGAGNASSFKNRIINGGMVIDQRNAGASSSVVNGTYYLDRFACYTSTASDYTVGQNLNSATPPAGFQKYMGFQSAIATSPAASDYHFFAQQIEANNISDIQFGSAGAKSLTLSFWVRSSLTGTFGGAITNNNSTRSYPFSFTIDSANTWEQKSVTIPGDTSGTWSLSGTGSGMFVRFMLGSGSNRTGTVNTWASANYDGPTGCTALTATSGATYYITGVQLEVGTVATSFDFRSYGTEYQLCQRYFEKSIADGTAANATTNPAPTLVGANYSSVTTRTQIFYKVPKRATPTLTRIPSSTGGSGSQWAWYSGGWSGGATNVAQQNANSFSVDITISGTAFQSTIIDGNWYADAEL